MTRRSRSPSRLAAGGLDDRGSGTVWVLALSTLVMLVGAALVLLVQLRVARAQAATAADLAALAAASALPGSAEPCAAAREVAEAQQTRLLECSAHGPVVDVLVGKAFAGRLAGLPGVRVRSRAGPPEVH